MGDAFYIDDLVARGEKGQFGNKDPRRDRQSNWHDLRLGFLDPQLITGRRVLYVGHGDGRLPLQIAARFAPARMECIDADIDMVAAAVRNMDLLEKAFNVPRSHAQEMTGLACFRDEAFGFGLTAAETPDFPLRSRVVFRKNNVLALSPDFGFLKFDAIFCLRLTKYVHLNFGDEAIHILFHNLGQLLGPGGTLYFEAQSRAGYARSRGACAQFRAMLPELKLRPEEFLVLLKSVHGFALVDSFEYARNAKGRKGTVHLLRKI